MMNSSVGGLLHEGNLHTVINHIITIKKKHDKSPHLENPPISSNLFIIIKCCFFFISGEYLQAPGKVLV